DAAGAQRLEAVPAGVHAGRAGDCVRRPALGALGVAAAHGQQRAAALVHRLDEDRALGGLGPLVEPALGGVPVARPQLQLGQVQAAERVGGGLAPLVREVEQALEDPAGLAQLAAPHVALAGHA